MQASSYSCGKEYSETTKSCEHMRRMGIEGQVVFAG